MKRISRIFDHISPRGDVGCSSPSRRRVLVTGGSSGIGMEIVRLFASNGDLVGVIDLSDVAAEMSSVRSFRVDVSDVEGVAAAVEKFGPVDVRGSDESVVHCVMF